MKNKLYFIMTMIMTVIFTCMLSMNSAQAKSVNTWADKKFDFSTIKSVAIYEVEKAYNFKEVDESMVRDIINYNESSMGKLRLRVIGDDEILPGKSIRFVTTIEKWEVEKEKHEGYVSKEKQKATRIKTDKNGRKVKETYYKVVPVKHSVYYIDRFTVKIRYDGYTPKGKLVYSYTELRNREKTNSCIETYKAIATNFKQKLAKKAKRLY